MSKVAISEEYLTDIADSIREKLNSQDTYKVSEMSEAIDSIETGGGGLDWSAIGYSDTPQLIIDGYNHALQIKNNWTGDTDLYQKFANDKNLVFLPKLISNVSSFRNTFQRCTSLIYGDFSGFNTSNLTRTDNMFAYCYALLEVDLSNFYTPNLDRCQNMFYYCMSLKKIDIRNMSLSQITNSTYYNNMFGGEDKGVPNNCLIIVKDNTEKTWITSKFIRLTNVKTVDEYNASV